MKFTQVALMAVSDCGGEIGVGEIARLAGAQEQHSF
jgi:hypothetical protein